MADTANVVTFSYADWIAAYPEFATVTQQQAEGYFALACVQINNAPSSPIPLMDCGGNPVREPILNAATAHIAQLFFTPAGKPPQQTVGRVSSATQGSVNVALDMGTQPRGAAWWNTTKYGAMVWMMTQPYRMARYLPRPSRYLGVGPGPLAGYSGAWN